jgi:hypothetical protein
MIAPYSRRLADIGEIDMTQDKIREIKNLVDIWGKNPATLEFSNLILGLIWSIVRERVEVEQV